MIRYNYLTAGLIALLFFISSSLFSQTTPYFEMTLNFEDNLGNRDSIIFGYDIDATEDIDEEFDETELITPFDSLFDVRIGSRDFFFFGEKLTKRLISSTEVVVNEPECLSGAGAYIYINAVNQPVKIWWNQNALLSNECFRGGFIIDHIADKLGGPFPPDEIPSTYYCMANVDTAVFNTSEEYMLTSEWPVISIEKEIEGQGIKRIYGLRLVINPSWSYTPCYWVTSTDNLSEIQELYLSPNPVQKKLTLFLPENKNPESIEIYSTLGRNSGTRKANFNGNEIDVSGLASGFYYVYVKSTDGKLFRGNFIKK